LVKTQNLYRIVNDDDTNYVTCCTCSL